MKIKLACLEKNVYGRHAFSGDGGLIVSWNLSGFCMSFRGTGARIYLGGFCSGGDTVYVRAEIDGKPWGYGRATENGAFKIDSLANAEHTLVLRRVGGSVTTVCIKEVELIGDDTEILPPPPMPSLRMEFIGDSITYGFGLLCERFDGFNADTDGDGTGSYAYLTAKALDADIRTEAISGQGIVCRYDGEHGKPIPEFFEYDDTELTMPHDFTSWTPDVVVINAGTNDSIAKLEAEPFCEGAHKLLDRVREVYPDAEVFYAYGIMGDVYKVPLGELIEKRAKNDKKLHFVPIEPISDGEIGVREHPNCKGHERAARVLTDAIRAVIGKN